MKAILPILLSVAFLMMLCGCEHRTEPPVEHNNPWWGTEKAIRERYDGQATFYWNDYHTFLSKLSSDSFVVLPINEMRNYFDTSKVVIGLRHDIDNNPFKALEMKEIEKGYGIRSTWYILATALYYGEFSKGEMIRNKGMDSLYKCLCSSGSEIGIHNDLLTVMISWAADPATFNSSELSWYNSLGITIKGTASHGSEIAKETVPNYEIFSDFATKSQITYGGMNYPIGIKSLKDFGYEYEAYHINYSIYFSDSRGKWNLSSGLSGVLDSLDKCKHGSRVQILVHPDWWGKI